MKQRMQRGISQKWMLDGQHQVRGMRELAVLTYNQKHRKTYDTLCLVKAK